MRTAMARFPFHKTLESFDFKFQPSICSAPGFLDAKAASRGHHRSATHGDRI
jgi:DNA replication protein DnaC